MTLAVRVPGSSANIGPGFDVFGLALAIYCEVGLVEGGSGHDFLVDDYHPATRAFRDAGGVGNLWVDSRIPSGRGLGFSGAVRVAGASLGLAQKHGLTADALSSYLPTVAHEVLALSGRLEGHFDNVAASTLGGFICADEARVISVPLHQSIFDELVVMIWVPYFQTATAKSRITLPRQIERSDAVFNLAKASQLIVGLMTGDIDTVRHSVFDRLHQDQRLRAVPRCAEVMDECLSNGAISTWLSGSGPSIAMFVERHKAQHVATTIADKFSDGDVKILEIDRTGVTAI